MPCGPGWRHGEIGEQCPLPGESGGGQGAQANPQHVHCVWGGLSADYTPLHTSLRRLDSESPRQCIGDGGGAVLARGVTFEAGWCAYTGCCP